MIELDGTKIQYYKDRVLAWERGEHIAPITIDMALTTTCNMACEFCYRYLQHNKRHTIRKEHINRLLEDASAIGVKGISLVSDGESSISPIYAHTIQYGASLGLAMASGTNAYLLKGRLLESVLPHLTYLRVNISAGEEARYNEIMGARGDHFRQVIANIRTMVRMRDNGLSKCTLGMQMVFMPKYEDQVIPLARLAIDLGVDYLQIKHCSDDELNTLGVDYGGYEKTYATLKKAEALSTDHTLIKVKWSKIKECSGEGAVRSYSRCYAIPFILQISGTGLVAPCGMLFNERYKAYHMGNITEQGFKEIWNSRKYWAVVEQLASNGFDARRMCGSLCLQHSVNKWLTSYKSGEEGLVGVNAEMPMHKEFI